MTEDLRDVAQRALHAAMSEHPVFSPEQTEQVIEVVTDLVVGTLRPHVEQAVRKAYSPRFGGAA